MAKEDFSEDVVENPSVPTVIEEETEVEVSSGTMPESVKELLHVLGDVFGSSTEKAVKAINAKNKLENVAIFVDYDNVYWTLINNFNHDPNHEDEEKNLFLRLWERYGEDNIRSFRAYADFQKVRSSLTSLQKKRIQVKHVYSNEKDGDARKNSSDIELCIDAIESTYKDSNIGTYVFVTADSDMIPILSRMMYKGKRVELFYLSKAAPRHVDITNYAHFSQDLLEFLNVEVVQHQVERYVAGALGFINWWEEQYSKSDQYLGKGWLRGQLVQKLSIPADVSSELIERLLIEELVYEGRKARQSGEVKTSLTLTEKGREYLHVPAAAAKEEKTDENVTG